SPIGRGPLQLSHPGKRPRRRGRRTARSICSTGLAMSNTPSNPSHRAWRPQPAARPAPASDARRWRREPGASGGTARRWVHRFGFGLLALAFLACTGLFVWAVLWLWPPPPARLVLVGAGYETNLAVPPNVYGR